VAENPTLSWRTGFWFWMTQTGAGSMTSHSAIINNRGFGETIRTINGALECNGKSPAQVQSRVDNYKRLCNMLGVAPGTNLQC
jgi:chitinase